MAVTLAALNHLCEYLQRDGRRLPLRQLFRVAVCYDSRLLPNRDEISTICRRGASSTRSVTAPPNPVSRHLSHQPGMAHIATRQACARGDSSALLNLPNKIRHKLSERIERGGSQKGIADAAGDMRSTLLALGLPCAREEARAYYPEDVGI
jgi:hypothetical protein